MGNVAKGNGPLAGVRVVDLTAMVMGPYCTQIMADMGADVIKIEPPEGDNTRYISVGPAPGMCGVFVNVNRGKRSVVLDLRSDAGKTALRKLIERADVFVHSMRSKAIAQARVQLRGRRRDQSRDHLHQLLRIQPARSGSGPDRLRRHDPGGMRIAGRPADADRRSRATSARSWPTRSPA